MILHPEEKHDDAGPDRPHEGVVKHLDGEAPFRCRNLLCNCLFLKIPHVEASVAHLND
jgi:hypothetical protein